MKYYELTCLISPDFSEEKIISYFPTRPIKKQLTSSLIVLDFYSEPGKIAEIEKKIRADSQVLRHMILTKKVPGAEVKPPRRTPKLPGESFFKARGETEEKKVKEKKVELKDVEKKLEEILGE